MSDINYDSNFTASVAANVKYSKITIAKSISSSTADDDAIKAFN